MDSLQHNTSALVMILGCTEEQAKEALEQTKNNLDEAMNQIMDKRIVTGGEPSQPFIQAVNQ